MDKEIQKLNERVANIEKMLEILIKSERYTFNKNIQIEDGRSIRVGRGTGTSFGSAVDQKIGLYGVTPIVQQPAITDPTAPGATYSQAVASSAVNSILAIRNALQNIGIIA